MNDPSIEHLEIYVKETAAAFQYPPTPDIAAELRGRPAPQHVTPRPMLRWALAILLVLCLGLLAATAVPPVRAALLRFLNIGAIQINLLEEPSESAAEQQPVSIVDLGEPISLEEAGDLITLREPNFPPALGDPDRVFGQNLLYQEPIITFIWYAGEDRPQIVLTQIEIPQFGIKWASGDQVTETEIAGKTAVWIEGPHLFDLADASIDQNTIITANVLIWSEDNSTYRLEGDLTLPQARAIAESWR